MFRNITLFISLSLVLLGCSLSDKEREAEKVRCDAFKTRTAIQLTTLKAGDILSILTDYSCECYHITDNTNGRISAYKLHCKDFKLLYGSPKEIINQLGVWRYSIIRSNTEKWKDEMQWQILLGH